ncbi:MAG: TraR/DksA family transcriptional regulator [Desulfurivibrio sp.]|nr:MAG: TraR/DksA family transcriptional regulator [Desulfurivibrio sp.]
MHSEYVDSFSSDLARTRADLLSEYFNCQREMASGEYRKVVGSGLEEGDRSTMYHFDQMTLFKLASFKKQLDQIDRALNMIKSGDYGICSCCHSEIGVARLRSVPFAVHCRDCQEQLDRQVREKTGKTAC